MCVNREVGTSLLSLSSRLTSAIGRDYLYL